MESGTEIFSKGSLVEVSSDEDGFKGAWYVATILESPPKSASKKRSRALVEYQDLLVDDVGSKPLTEVVDTSFLRPLPPPEADTNFCVNDIVDAFYRDGWWTGVITRISEDSKCTVFFQNPPDEIQFDRSDLRVHKEWVDGKWIRPEKQRTTGLIFSPGAAVEVTLNEQSSRDAWFPAIVRREIGLGSYVVQCQSLKNSGEAGVLDVTVDNLHIRPSPPRLEGRKFGLLEKVDAFYDYGWWNGIVTKVLTGRRYVVFFKHTNMEKEFIHSDLRPHMEWVDGKWVGATQEVLGTTYSDEQLGLVLNNSNNTSVGMQLESSGTVIDDAGDMISHSTRFEKDRLEQPATYLENSTSSVMTSNRKKVKETTSGDDATPSRPSKKLKEGDVADAPISHAVGQLRMAPIETLIQEVPCGFANPTTGGTGSNQTEQPVAGNQSSTKTGSASQGMKVGNEQKSSGLGNQTPNSVKRKGRPPKSQVKIAQPFPAGEEVNTVQNAEGTVEKEYTTNNVDMDMAVGLPSNAEEGTLAENPSDHPNEESLKVMRDQKRHFDATARHKSKEIGKKEEGTVSTQLKRRGRPPKKLENRNPEASSEGRAPRVSFKRSPKDSSAGRAPKLPVKRSPRTSMREPKLKRQRASAVGTKIKGPKATSEGSNLNNQMELEAGLDLNSLYASAAGKDDNEVGGVAYEMAIKDCKMNEVELPMSTVVESSAKRGSQTEIPVRHSRRAYRKRTTNQNLLGSRQKNVEGIKIRTPRTRKQKLPDESIGQALSKQLVKSSSKRGRRRSININSAPPTQGSQDALGEKTAPLVEIESKTKQVEMAVCGVASVPDDQPLSMWFDGMHSPGVADNSKLSPGQTVNQWNEARERPSEVTQSPRIDPTGEIMLDLNQSLPFVKSSPIWNTLETLEVFQRMPQKPHFRPLENCKEERREGLAIGNMVTFSTLIEKVAKLRFDDPRSIFGSSLEALVELEMHGFDTKPVQSRINELVFIKDQQEQLKGRTKEVENQIMEHTHEKTKIDEEIYEIDKKMIELQEKRALAVSNKESKDSEIAALLSSADAMNESIQSARQDFERVATSPW